MTESEAQVIVICIDRMIRDRLNMYRCSDDETMVEAHRRQLLDDQTDLVKELVKLGETK